MTMNGSRSEQLLVSRRTQKSTEAHGKLTKLIAAGKAAEAERFWRDYMIDTAAFMAKTKLDTLKVQVRS
jgi:DNA-binding FadR family transcriptional regulator